MLELTHRLNDGKADKTLTLSRDQRAKCRQRVVLDDGTQAGLFLERGQTLRDGDLIGSTNGVIVEIKAAPEPVSIVRCDDALLMARLCYHLGNRHVALRIEADNIAYQHDHVLDNMVRGFGLQPGLSHLPFEPEPGAYGGHPPHHGH